MKPTTALRTAGGVAGTDGGRPLRQSLLWGMAGLGLGVVSASAYLLLGGEYFGLIPRWASIVFYPGFLVGYQVYDWGLSREASKVVGVLALGSGYAAVGALARVTWFALNHRHRPVVPRPKPE